MLVTTSHRTLRMLLFYLEIEMLAVLLMYFVSQYIFCNVIYVAASKLTMCSKTTRFQILHTGPKK